MLDESNPDYSNSPDSVLRPERIYAPIDDRPPLVSVITACHNTGAHIQETLLSLQRMSFCYWEWLIVDDGSSDITNIFSVTALEESEPRIRVLRQENAGLAAARNQAVAIAQGKYLLILDPGDMVEPTFVEKALWVLETQPQYVACNSYAVELGMKNQLRPAGFYNYEDGIREGWVTRRVMIRRDVFLEIGGYDEESSNGQEDWDLWLRLANAGLWGYTIAEHLTWDCASLRSSKQDGASKAARARAFRKMAYERYPALRTKFPRPAWVPDWEISLPPIISDAPFENPLRKPDGVCRVLLIIPWMNVGGTDKVNLDFIRMLSKRGYEFTVVTTLNSEDKWLSEYTALTPDVFRPTKFIHRSDLPRFLNYLIRSRQINVALMSNSELAFSLTPYLRAHNPQLAIVNFAHSEVEEWKSGGYPHMATMLGHQIDLNLTATRYLKDWMIRRGADPEHIEVCHCGIETAEWRRDLFNATRAREKAGVTSNTPIVLYVARFSEEKRPLAFVQIVERAISANPNFVAVMIGDGPERHHVESYIKKKRLGRHIRLLGALPQASVREIMAAADIIIAPSSVEGLAIVLMEAMAMEMVPIAVDIAGHPELVTPECGYLVARSDHEIEEYARRLVDLLSNPAKRGDMTQAGRSRVVEFFDLERFGDRMDAAIQRACTIAAEHPPVEMDLDAASYMATLAIDHQRLGDLTDYLWLRNSKSKKSAERVPFRRRILPYGTRRYELWKRIRATLLLPVTLSRQMAHGHVPGSPISGEAAVNFDEPSGYVALPSEETALTDDANAHNVMNEETEETAPRGSNI